MVAQAVPPPTGLLPWPCFPMVPRRLSLRKGKAEQRLMKVVDSPNLPEAEASFTITGEGVDEYKD